MRKTVIMARGILLLWIRIVKRLSSFTLKDEVTEQTDRVTMKQMLALYASSSNEYNDDSHSDESYDDDEDIKEESMNTEHSQSDTVVRASKASVYSGRFSNGVVSSRFVYSEVLDIKFDSRHQFISWPYSYLRIRWRS